MGTVSSKDGTTIAYDRLGEGPAVVLISGGPSDRTGNAPLAEALAAHCTVYNYDRRGRGESGDTTPYTTDREFDDLAAVIAEAGGSAALIGNSGTGNIALEAAMRGLPVTRLALWEPPYILPGTRPAVPADWGDTVEKLVSEGRPGDAMAYWMTTVVGVPEEYVKPMREDPFFTGMAANAHMLVRDAALLRDFALPTAPLAEVTVPVLVLEGGSMPWLSEGARALTDALPDSRLVPVEGQGHDIAPDHLADLVTPFLTE